VCYKNVHCFAKRFIVSLFRHFAKHFVSLVSRKSGMRNKQNVHETATLFVCFATPKLSRLAKKPCWLHEVNHSSSIFFATVSRKVPYFVKRFVICFSESFRENRSFRLVRCFAKQHEAFRQSPNLNRNTADGTDPIARSARLAVPAKLVVPYRHD
jgi:hypothetical protein